MIKVIIYLMVIFPDHDNTIVTLHIRTFQDSTQLIICTVALPLCSHIQHNMYRQLNVTI